MHLKDTRTGVGGRGADSAGTFVGECAESIATDQPEVVLDDGRAIIGVITKPGSVSIRVFRGKQKGSVGVGSISLGITGGSVDRRLLLWRAAIVSPLLVDAGDGKVSGELNLSGILNSGEEVSGGVVGIDVDEVVRWLDEIVSRASWSEVIRSGN